MNAWTVNEIETLLKLWPTKSATQIAREIQRSRAAVCGKMNRLRSDGVIPSYLPKQLEIDLRRKPKLNQAGADHPDCPVVKTTTTMRQQLHDAAVFNLRTG